MMIRLFAAHPLLHVNGTNPWMDSAYAPAQPVIVVRPPRGRGAGGAVWQWR